MTNIKHVNGNVESLVRAALAVLVLTSVHHAYGAHVYRTPWRYHVLLLALPAAAAIAWLGRRLGDADPPLWRWLFVLTTALVPILGIGAFEGAYNHVFKDGLFFAGASPALMTRLFPPPTYEMPNDLFFELTGVAQAVVGAVAAWRLGRFLATTRTSPAARR